MSAQKTLIPPLTLYRQILRAHRVHLPPQLRILGDGYVKAEFHRHKDVENPLYIVGFLEQWQDYLNHVVSSSPNAQAQQHTSSSPPSTIATSAEKTREQTLEQIVAQGKPFGKKLDLSLLEKMNDQQLGQLYELRKETLGLQSQQELEKLAEEEAQLLEKVAATLPASALSRSSSSSN